MVRKEALKVILILILLLPLGIFVKFLIPLLSALIAFTIFFFRDPEREIGNWVVSPADGKIDFVKDGRLEIFMGLFDCHIQRSPVSGIVKKITFVPGKKRPAFIRGENEKKVIEIESEEGTFIVELIAGIFARRIICWVKEGEKVEKGQRISMIVFGSRVALEVPENYVFVKKVGEKVKAGETVAVRR